MESTPETTYTATQCQQCGGICKPQLVTLTLRRSHYGFALVRNVPADVCQHCGESQFSMTTTGQMLARLQADRAPDDVAVIPIYDLAVVQP